MKEIKVKPEDLIFTRWSDFEPVSGLEQIPESEYWQKVPPIIVMKHPKKEAFLIYNGNHRAMVAKSKKIMVKALLVESEEDLSKIPPAESMYHSDPEHYRKYDNAIARLIQKSEFFNRKQLENSGDARRATKKSSAGIPVIVKGSTGLMKENNCKKVLTLDYATDKTLIYLVRQGFQVYGVASSDTEAEITKKRIEGKGHINVQIKMGSMRSAPFRENEFDAVIAIAGIQNQTMEQVRKTIKEAHRVLRKGGLFLLSLPTREHPDYGKGIALERDTFIGFDGSHSLCHYFSDEEIERELKPLFRITAVWPKHAAQDQARNAHIVLDVMAKKR